MTIDFTDKTGDRLEKKDFDEANTVVTAMVPHMLTLPPELGVQLMNIRRCLIQGRETAK